MQKLLKIASFVGKIAGGLATIDATPLAPKWGPVIFIVSSILKDAVNRIQDFADDGKLNNSTAPKTE